MRIMRKILTAAMLVNSGPLFAVALGGVTPGLVGSENNGTIAYIGILPNPDNCIYGGVYFVAPADPKVALSVALAAKMAGKTLRIDYSQPEGRGTSCKGYGIYVE